ncbi:MAG TPA: excinuclease ABC subunit C [Candidatus Omnitrophica bacterium]|nr:excinuclease ABC subunit C [Candidatus Omnitrophota bacterium]HCI44650.1 excinuclease ABC subunit C [Candidatus Omnitrophota bacterium]
MLNIQQKIKTLPFTSGVYLMKDASGRVIYVGKAISLRKRVQSYFRSRRGVPSKTDALVNEIRAIDHIETASEAGALLLEAGLIKEYRPKYNVELKDDKSYPYIEITGEPFPRISLVRRVAFERGQERAAKGAVYYGPYVSAGLVREALTIIRKIFHFRTCDPFPREACLDYHIGLCDAPCIGNISNKDYARNIRNVRLILGGEKDVLYKDLKKDMEDMSRKHEFEGAARVRDQIRAIGALYSGTRDINYFKEAEQLQRALNLPRLPERVETFDISNIMAGRLPAGGNQAVGSMVSFFNGKPDKANYRRFRIREVEGIDDFQMLAEIIRRRYRRLKREGRIFPDLIIVDGGKGQLSAAVEALVSLEVRIPVIAIAKREEEVFLPGKRDPVRLAQDSLALQLVQRMRDEAHRFAVAYHRLLREKKVFE